MSAGIAYHQAFVAGDLAALKRALGEPADFPLCRGLLGPGESLLEYAIYHSPLDFVRTLLQLGVEVNYEDIGYPALLAALAAERADRTALVELLLAHGAEIDRRGVNGYTALHWAAWANDAAMVRLLLARGADPSVRTGVDADATALEEIAGRGFAEIEAMLEGAAMKKKPR